jgi:RNA polymerase sigma factor (sigma-70 family)
MTHASPGRHRQRGPVAAEASATESPGLLAARRDTLIGDPSAADRLVSDLYREHGLALVRVALMLVGDKATAEDVVQDAFIGLYRGLHRLSSTEKALAYLRVSVVNGCRSVHRSRRTALLRPGQTEAAVWSAEAAVMAREDSRLALQAVSRLPRRSREVLVLRYFLDMPDPEIAAALGVARGTVSSTASRALAALAQALKEEL